MKLADTSTQGTRMLRSVWLAERMKERTILDEMVLRQTLQATGAREALGHHDPNGGGDFVPLGVRPAVHVLQQVRQRGRLERFFEILVPDIGEGTSLATSSECRITGVEIVTNSPPNEFVQNLDILLHVCHLHRLLGVEKREGRERRAIVDILTTGLEEATDEEDLEQGVCILQILESRASLD